VRCDGRGQARDGGSRRSSHDEWRAQRRCEQRWRAGAARRWANTHPRPVRRAASTSHSPQNRPRPPFTAPAAPAGSIHKTTCRVLPFFVRSSSNLLT
jgi:hypothetical protein